MRTDEAAALSRPGARPWPPALQGLASVALALLGGRAVAPSVSLEPAARSAKEPANFADAVAAARPATVGVQAMPLRSQRRSALSEEDLLDPPPAGAGFVFAADGLIVTAAHVVTWRAALFVWAGKSDPARLVLPQGERVLLPPDKATGLPGAP